MVPIDPPLIDLILAAPCTLLDCINAQHLQTQFIDDFKKTKIQNRQRNIIL
jgi:hypothetical protein